MNITERKKVLVKKYGTKPTITYYYYLLNVVNYAGQKRVKQSFKSIYNQGNEVIVGIYNPQDNTKKIAKDFGFRVLTVEKDHRYIFPESKIRNKIIFESKSNFLCALNINVEYPKKLTPFIQTWIKGRDITKQALKLRYKLQASTGATRDKYYGFSFLFYRPYLIEARGYDERTSYALGSQKYGTILLKNFFKLRVSGEYIGLVHKYHNHIKIGMLGKFFPKVPQPVRRSNVGRLIGALKANFSHSFDYGVKKVKNSYF